MRFGICGSPDELSLARAAGFDYVEYWGSTVFGGETKLVNTAEASNGFFPGNVSLFGESPIDWRSYAERTIRNGADAGVKVMVVGSGNQRRHPGASGDAEFLEIVKELSRIGKSVGVDVAPESLNRLETNVFCSLKEMAETLGANRLPYVADSYHELKEWEFDGVTPGIDAWRRSLPFAPVHVHIGNVTRDDVNPDDPALIAFKDRLRELEYDGRITYEGKRGTDLESLSALNQRMRALFA